MSTYPDTREGAIDALRYMARPHSLRAVRKGSDGPGHWMLVVRFTGEDEDVTCAVYLTPHPLAEGTGADFETLED